MLCIVIAFVLTRLITQNNAAGAGESATAAEALNSQSVELTAVADQLSTMVGMKSGSSQAVAQPEPAPKTDRVMAAVSQVGRVHVWVTR